MIFSTPDNNLGLRQDPWADPHVRIAGRKTILPTATTWLPFGKVAAVAVNADR